MGARPMARVIQQYIKRPLADDLLFGELKLEFEKPTPRLTHLSATSDGGDEPDD